jgi:hypothetical protein
MNKYIIKLVEWGIGGNTVSRITLGVVVINQDEGTKRMCMTIFPERESHSTLGGMSLYFSPSSV